MLSQKQINDIVDHAAASDLALVNWSGRGRAPAGYIKGMAVTYGLCLQKLAARDSAALAMVRGVDGAHDVFDHPEFEPRLRALGLATDGAPEVDRLRALFVILAGLGMRESSGGSDIGQDASAPGNRAGEKAEAGWFQQSWDSRGASPEIVRLFRSPDSQTFLEIFREGVQLRPGAMENYGDGDGRAFQAALKTNPALAVQCAALCLRALCNHFGPINTGAAEVRPEADALFRQVQTIVGVKSSGTAGKPAAPSTGWFAMLVAAVMAFFRRATTKPPAVPVPPIVPPLGSSWMRWAAKEVGFHETGTNRNIGRYTGPAKCGSEGDPWCAIFVNAALESSGVRGTRSAMARSFEHDSNFVKLDGPAFGAVTTMWRGSPGSGLGHVFFYVGHLDGSRVLALGGNQSDQVCRQAEPANRIVGYWWPKSVALPKTGKITVTDDNSEEGSET